MSQPNNLSDYFPLLNQQIVSQELLSEYLLQIEAMFDVALSGDLLSHKKTTIHYYLSTIHDITSQAKDINQQQLNYLIKIARMIRKPKAPTPPEGEKVH